tara:strand:- start:2318 stop:2500 length:183 start_codon:yes stop_codon:yes gene_type:complete
MAFPRQTLGIKLCPVCDTPLNSKQRYCQRECWNIDYRRYAGESIEDAKIRIGRKLLSKVE